MSEYVAETWEPTSNSQIAEIVAMLNLARSSQIDESFFRWKHCDNPSGQSIITLVRDRATGELAGVRALWCMPLYADGKPVIAFQPCDTATHPRHRQRGVFKRMTRLAVETAVARGGEVLFNFPNPVSKIGYRSLGWQDVGGIVRLVKLHRPIHALIALSGRLEFEGSLPRSPPAIDWNYRDLRGFRVIRNRQCAGWRFSPHAKRDYHWCSIPGGAVAVFSSGRLRGMREAKLLDVSDAALAQHGDLRKLVSAVAEESRADVVTAFLTKGHPLIWPLMRLGFLPAFHRANFMVLPLGHGPEARRWVQPQNWRLSGADVDTF